MWGIRTSSMTTAKSRCSTESHRIRPRKRRPRARAFSRSENCFEDEDVRRLVVDGAGRVPERLPKRCAAKRSHPEPRACEKGGICCARCHSAILSATAIPGKKLGQGNGDASALLLQADTAKRSGNHSGKSRDAGVQSGKDAVGGDLPRSDAPARTTVVTAARALSASRKACAAGTTGAFATLGARGGCNAAVIGRLDLSAA